MTWIRHTHPNGFRSGQWGLIHAVRLVGVDGGADRPSGRRLCFRVVFPDGVRDLWPIYDEMEPYEFTDTDPALDSIREGR